MAMLEMRDVEVSFSGFRAIAGLNLSVNQGELRCLVGPNGAGKTTALDVICGKTRLARGHVRYRDREIGNSEEFRIARLGVGRKFQVPSVFKELTVRENLRVGLCKPHGVFSNLVGRKSGESAERLEALACLVGLADELDHPASWLSHGQTQWLEIALLLAQNADLILMDEPTAGMTGAETHKTAELFNQLKGKHTLMVVEHDMGFVREIGDVISVMHQGRMLAEGAISEIERNPEVKRAYLGSGRISDA
ncbi:MAG: urea ABC transporter ATP-binding protein UrtD [Rhizobiaceae bacterium]|jgi:urea transport system ATP-binding protein|nr:MAG: urea ABC transporter ATP-binding protein UrtD [Rhizobiaceae bacterium]